MLNVLLDIAAPQNAKISLDKISCMVTCVLNNGLLLNFVTEKGWLKHSQAVKNVYVFNAVDNSSFSRWSSRIADSEKCQAQLSDARRSGHGGEGMQKR